MMIYIFASLLPAVGLLGAYYAFHVIQLYLTRSKLIREYGCQPTAYMPQKDPILGLDLFIKMARLAKEHHLVEDLKQRFDTYGNTYSSTTLGTTAINTIEPQNIQTVWALKFKDYGIEPFRLPPMKPFPGRGIFTSDGPYWEHSRALIRPTFNRANLANLAVFELHVRKLIDIIPRDESTVDLQALLHNLFLDSVTELLFGESINMLSPDTMAEAQKFLEAFHKAQKGTLKRLMMGKLRFLYYNPQWKEACKSAHTFAENYVDKALEFRKSFLAAGKLATPGKQVEEKSYILLYEIAKQTGNRIELRNQILHIFLAAHDTTAITLSNAFLLLSRHQDKWEKLRKEVLANGTAPITYDLLKSLKYVRYVLNETLRIYPVVPTNTRIAYTDTILPVGGGSKGTAPVLVRAGQKIVTNIYALHRRRDLWGENAESFEPQRWESVRPTWEYQPFGGGPRICPGQQLALTEASYVLVRMAQEFKGLDSRDDRPWTEDLKLTAANLHGCMVALTAA